MLWDLLNKFNKPKSVYFFTLHKSASTLFGNLILGSTLDLIQIDYASKIYMGELTELPQFEKTGYIYGPIRVWKEDGNSESRLLLEPCLEKEFLKDKKCLLFIRDPRDILVSFYYSVAFTHGISDVPEIAKIQLERRTTALELGIDRFCMQFAPKILENFKIIVHIQNLCRCSLLLRYEDMVEDFQPFANKLTAFLDLNGESIGQLYKQSRPLFQESSTEHKRSGLPGGYRTKLSDQTIDFINKKLNEILDCFYADKLGEVAPRELTIQ
jgi:hypothetical protein